MDSSYACAMHTYSIFDSKTYCIVAKPIKRPIIYFNISSVMCHLHKNSQIATYLNIIKNIIFYSCNRIQKNHMVKYLLYTPGKTKYIHMCNTLYFWYNVYKTQICTLFAEASIYCLINTAHFLLAGPHNWVINNNFCTRQTVLYFL